jgi:hypothetical protein
MAVANVEEEKGEKRPRESPVEFIMPRLEAVLTKRGGKTQYKTMFYALVKTSFSHPDYDGGNTFTIAEDEVMEWFAHDMGGGRAIFKLWSVIEPHRKGIVTTKLKGVFAEAGLTYVLSQKKQRVK